jgi:hypothetical protein
VISIEEEMNMLFITQKMTKLLRLLAQKVNDINFK